MRGIKLVVLSLAFVLILSMSFASAGFFSDIFSKYNGKVVDGDTANNCIDSDGDNPFVYGYVSTPSGIIGDHCLSLTSEGYDTHVIEQYCMGNVLMNKAYLCENGCLDGVCIGETSIGEEGDDDSFQTPPAEECFDSDGGIDYKIKSTRTYNSGSEVETCTDEFGAADMYRGPYVYEYYCVGEIIYECEYECVDGACVEESNVSEYCYDSDGGVNFYVKGVRNSSLSGIQEDFCSVQNSSLVNPVEEGPYVLEYSCESEILYECPNGCVDGACLEDQPVPCLETDEGLDYFMLGHNEENFSEMVQLSGQGYVLITSDSTAILSLPDGDLEASVGDINSYRGLTYEVVGIFNDDSQSVYVKPLYFDDECIGGNILAEYYCYEEDVLLGEYGINPVEYILFEDNNFLLDNNYVYECEESCSNGACYSTPSMPSVPEGGIGEEGGDSTPSGNEVTCEGAAEVHLEEGNTILLLGLSVSIDYISPGGVRLLLAGNKEEVTPDLKEGNSYSSTQGIDLVILDIVHSASVDPASYVDFCYKENSQTDNVFKRIGSFFKGLFVRQKVSEEPTDVLESCYDLKGQTVPGSNKLCYSGLREPGGGGKCETVSCSSNIVGGNIVR